LVLTNPDLFLDLIKPEEGGINLYADQRVFLRATTRYSSMYGVFSRGYGKTFCEVISMFILAVRYPNIELALTAQTKENAAELLKDKFNEILKFYPFFENEISRKDCRFSKNDAEVKFRNGAKIDVLANHRNTLGNRRKRLSIEEAAQLNDELFQEVLLPIVEVGRTTCGKLAIVDPLELNQQVHFYTTSWFRKSDEFNRSILMVKDMINLKSKFVIGSKLSNCFPYIEIYM